MLGTPAGGLLDSAGRWLLREVDYRVYALLTGAISAFFVLWRRKRYKSWPSESDYVKLVVSLLGIMGGLPVGIVFLLTKPPAVETLSGFSFAAIGLLVPIVTLAYGLPRLRALFFPSEAPRLSQEAATQTTVGDEDSSTRNRH